MESSCKVGKLVGGGEKGHTYLSAAQKLRELLRGVGMSMRSCRSLKNGRGGDKRAHIHRYHQSGSGEVRNTLLANDIIQSSGANPLASTHSNSVDTPWHMSKAG